MSTRYNNGSHYENHQRAAELHDEAAHAHRSAAQHHGKQDHETGAELSRRAMEHSRQAYLATQTVHQDSTDARGGKTFGHDDIAALAYRLWMERGCPEGTPEQDWHEAVARLRNAGVTGR